MRSLTRQQKRFCEHYAATGNATESATLAGYSRKTAYSIGAENLKKPEIVGYLETLTGSAGEHRITAAIERQEWLSRVIRGEVGDSRLRGDGSVIEVKPRMAERIRAAELLAKMRGDLGSRHKVGETVVVRRII
ncbi:MAG: terminase small subunit [Gammaproteobacteria bacterium]